MTFKQKRFIELYNGNATEAAKQAGYSDKTSFITGHKLLRHPKVAEAIKNRISALDKPKIATREEIQTWWTSMINDPDASKTDKLRASELLSKSNAWFIDKVESNNTTTVSMPTIKVGGQPVEFGTGTPRNA